MKPSNNAASGNFQKVNATQNNLDFFLSSPQKVVKKSTQKNLKKSNESSNLTTTNELDTNSLLNNSTQNPTEATATNADDYTRNTAGGNARPTPISADFAENIELNKTLLTDFIEALLEATPPEHKNAVEAALDILRYVNKHRFLSNTELFLEAFFVGLAKLNVPKEIIKLTTPILCEVLPNTTQELVERGLNNANIDSSYDLKFFENPDYKSDYDNFAGKFVDNSWLEMLNNENRLKFEPVEVLEMPPAEPEISQATGTDGDLPTQKLASIIDNAEAQKDAPANFKTNIIKGEAQKISTMNIINENSNTNNNAENITQNANSDVNSQNITDFINEATGNAFVLPKNENSTHAGAFNKDFDNLLQNENLIKFFVAVKPNNKLPFFAGWQKKEFTKNEVNSYRKKHNFGLRGGYLNFVDIDIKTEKDNDAHTINKKINFVKNLLTEIRKFFVENNIISNQSVLFVRGRQNTTSCAVPFICDLINTEYKHLYIDTEFGDKSIEIRNQSNSQTLCCGNHSVEGGRYLWNTIDGYFPTEFPTLTIQQYGDLLKLLTEKFSANTTDLLNKKVKKTNTQIKNNNNKQVITNNVSNDVIVNNNNSATDDYVAESNFVLDYLQKNNLITGQSNDGGYILECPFSHLHSTNNEKDFCFYPANTNNYKTFNFKCFHSHCSNKSKYDFVKALSSDLYNTIKKYEVKKFEDANGNVFLCSNDGLLVIENTGKVDENGNLITNKIKLLNKPFYIVGEFFNKHNQSSHGYIVEFENINGISQRLPIKSIDLHTDAVKTFAFLFDNGLKQLNTKIDKKKLCEQYLKGYLNCFDFKNSLYNYTNKSGWQGNSCDVYVRASVGDVTQIYFGENENDKYFYENKNKNSFYSTKGTFDEWKENVGKYAKNNPLLITSIFHCLTAFFLPELKVQDSIYFNLVGVSSKGKTTILNVCRSMIGSNDLNVTWAGTRAAFENLLQKYNHCFAPIDELSKADEKTLKTILEIIYSSKGKMLSNRDSNANREQKEWLITAISTSETTITELAQRYKINTMDGQNVRFIDVEFANANYKYGVFKDVDIKTGEDVLDGKNFAEKLEINSNLYYGTPMIELLNYLTTATAENPSVKKITKINATYNYISKDPKLTLCNKYYPATLNRIAKYFDMVMAVGVFLSNESFNLLDITHYEVIDAVKEIFNIIADNYKNDDGTFTTKTGRTILQDLRDFILQNETHFRRRLKDKDKPNDAIENLQVNYDIENLFGYYDVVKDNKGTTKIYYVIPSIFKNYVLKDTPLNTAFNELVKLNIAVTGKDKYFRKNTKYYDNKTNKETQTNLYVFKNLFQ